MSTGVAERTIVGLANNCVFTETHRSSQIHKLNPSKARILDHGIAF